MLGGVFVANTPIQHCSFVATVTSDDSLCARQIENYVPTPFRRARLVPHLGVTHCGVKSDLDLRLCVFGQRSAYNALFNFKVYIYSINWARLLWAPT